MTILYSKQDNSCDVMYFCNFQDEIQEEYMKQESKREWNEFKHGVLLDVINSRGIRPGYGKWSKE